MTRRLNWIGAVIAIVLVGGFVFLGYGFFRGNHAVFRLGVGVIVGEALVVFLLAARSRGLLRAQILDAGRILQLVLGLLVGCFHLALGLAAIFVFRNEEPASSWLFVFSGPWTTLPAAITAFFKPLIGGIWLFSGATVSFVVLAWTTEPHESELLNEFIWLTLPMIVLAGLGFWRWGLEKSSR